LRVKLGRVLSGTEYYVDLDGTNNNFLIVGMAGTGKSTLVKSMLFDLAGAEKSILVLDFTGEYRVLRYAGFREYIPGLNFFINPLDLPYARDIIFYIFQTIWRREVTPIQFAIVSELLEECRSIPELVERVRELRSRSRDIGMVNAYAAVENRLKPLSMLRAFSHTTELPTGHVHLNLAYIPHDVCRLVFALTLLHYFYYKSSLGEYEAILVIDEAEKVASVNPVIERNIVSRIFDELRKYGLFVWLISHTIRNLSPEIVNNTAHKVIFRLGHYDEALAASKILIDVDCRRILSLPNFHFFYRFLSTRLLRIDASDAIIKFKFRPVRPIMDLIQGVDVAGLIDRARLNALKKINPNIDRTVASILSSRDISLKLYRYNSGEISLDELPEICRKEDKLNKAAEIALKLILEEIEKLQN